VSVVNVVDHTGRAFFEYATERDVRAALQMPVDVVDDARGQYFSLYAAPVVLVNAGDGQCPRELDASVYLVTNRLFYRSDRCAACMPVLFSRVAVPWSRVGRGTLHYVLVNTDTPRKLRPRKG
jgi:hypothetical protein